MAKSIQQIASIVAKKEGHRSQARIGDIREILAILADMSYDCPDTLRTITWLGVTRAKRRARSGKPKRG